MATTLRVWAPLILTILVAGCGFATVGDSAYDLPRFFLGVWHGLLAPWTLVLRLFMDIKMYAFPNTGWFYDFGFLIGVIFSIPVGWVAAIIAIVVHLL